MVKNCADESRLCSAKVLGKNDHLFIYAIGLVQVSLPN